MGIARQTSGQVVGGPLRDDPVEIGCVTQALAGPFQSAAARG
jgi:hypothetical protein